MMVVRFKFLSAEKQEALLQEVKGLLTACPGTGIFIWLLALLPVDVTPTCHIHSMLHPNEIPSFCFHLFTALYSPSSPSILLCKFKTNLDLSFSDC